MTLDQFVDKYTGQSLSFDGLEANRGQCVQLVSYYVQDVVGCPAFFADAVYWFTTFGGSLPQYFDKIAKAPGLIPQRGDVVIWDGDLANSGGAGHIDICLSSTYESFVGFDSNWAGKYAHQVTHDWSHVLGWLHPKANQVQGESPMTKDEATSMLDEFYWKFTNRKVKQSELDEYVPQLVTGNFSAFFTKAAKFDEVKNWLASASAPAAPVDKGVVLDYLSKNLK